MCTINESPEKIESSGKKIARGVFWITSTMLLMRSLGLISTIVLARLLVPEDFGLIAISTSAILLIETSTEFGFNNALVRFQDITEDHFHTAWTLNVTRGIFVGAVVAAMALPFSTMMEDSRLQDLMLVVAILPILGSLRNTKFVLFEKRMDYTKEFILKTVAKSISVVTTITCAIVLQNYWALIIGMFAGRITEVIGTYVIQPHIPKIRISKYRDLFGFSVWLMLTNMVFVLHSRAYHFIVAKFIGNEPLGYYYMGREVTNYLTTDMVGSISRAMFPALSEVQSSKSETTRIFLEGLSITMGIAVPIGFGFAAVAPDIVLLVLGDKWLGAIPVIQFISPVMSLLTISSLVHPLTMAANKNHRLLARELIYLALKIGAVVIGIQLGGFTGVLQAAFWSGLIIFLLNIFISARLINEPIGLIISHIWRPIVAGCSMVLVVVLISGLMTPAATPLEATTRLTILVPTGVIVFVGTLLLLWHSQSKPAGFEARIIWILQIGQKKFITYRGRRGT